MPLVWRSRMAGCPAVALLSGPVRPFADLTTLSEMPGATRTPRTLPEGTPPDSMFPM